jgi:hypothetical protein
MLGYPVLEPEGVDDEGDAEGAMQGRLSIREKSLRIERDLVDS